MENYIDRGPNKLINKIEQLRHTPPTLASGARSVQCTLMVYVEAHQDYDLRLSVEDSFMIPSVKR